MFCFFQCYLQPKNSPEEIFSWYYTFVLLASDYYVYMDYDLFLVWRVLIKKDWNTNRVEAWLVLWSSVSHLAQVKPRGVIRTLMYVFSCTLDTVSPGMRNAMHVLSRPVNDTYAWNVSTTRELWAWQCRWAAASGFFTTGTWWHLKWSSSISIAQVLSIAIKHNNLYFLCLTVKRRPILFINIVILWHTNAVKSHHIRTAPIFAPASYGLRASMC